VVSLEQGECSLESSMPSLPQRHCWSRTENETVLRCYYKASAIKRGYRARMYELWLQSCPETPFTEQRIADQAISLLCRKAFTELELESIHLGIQGGSWMKFTKQ